jgi:transposase-like protein
MGRIRRTFSEEVKRKAVEDFNAGLKSAAQVSTEHNVAIDMVYKWKIQLEAKAKGERVDELESSGISRQTARQIQDLEDEVAEYRRKLGELALENDLLKKLRGLKTSRSESELNGLIDTIRLSARKRGHLK